MGNITFSCKALDSLKTPVFLKNASGIYIYCNEAFVSFLGIPEVKILGHTAYDVAPSQVADIHTAVDNELLNEAKSIQLYRVDTVSSSGVRSTVFKKSIFHAADNQIAGFIGAVETDSEEENRIRVPKGIKGYGITAREFEVLRLLVKGLSAKAIASSLAISSHTVSGHIKSIYIKLDVHSKNEALYKTLNYLALGLTPPPILGIDSTPYPS